MDADFVADCEGPDTIQPQQDPMEMARQIVHNAEGGCGVEGCKHLIVDLISDAILAERQASAAELADLRQVVQGLRGKVDAAKPLVEALVRTLNLLEERQQDMMPAFINGEQVLEVYCKRPTSRLSKLEKEGGEDHGKNEKEEER